MDERLSKYPKTELFRVKDTIGVPHPYCIGTRHVVEAADHFCGMLGKKGIRCAMKFKDGGRCQLAYEQHETALLIEVNHPGELKDVPGLNEYLLSIKEMCIKDGFAGMAFINGIGQKGGRDAEMVYWIRR